MNIIDFLVILFSALTLHRVWNYEPITEKLRAVTTKLKLPKKPIWCAPCNAFWFGLIALLIWRFTTFEISLSLALFMPLRILVWVYKKLNKPTIAASMQPGSKKIIFPPQTLTEASPPKLPPPVAASATQTQTQTHTQKVVIMTALSDFRPSYSITSAVLDQAIALAMTHPAWDIQVWVMRGAQDPLQELPANISIRKVIPPSSWVENSSNEDEAIILKDIILKELRVLGDPVIITHDLLFVTWYALFARAIHLIGAQGGFAWLHIPHSLPGDRQRKSMWLTNLPSGNHRVLTVSAGSEQAFSDYYQTTIDRVWHSPNIRDPRSWGTMSARVKKVVTQTKLGTYDFVQIYPICTTRLEAKGFSKLARTFAMINEARSAFMLICNPNASGGNGPGIIEGARSDAKRLGLPSDRWAFTSDLLPESRTYGLDADEIKSLMYSYGNILIFPSIAEADSLLLREAQLAGQYTIGNADVFNISDDAHHAVHWGKTIEVDDAVCRSVANKLKFMTWDEHRRRVLRERSLEVIGHRLGDLISQAGRALS